MEKQVFSVYDSKAKVYCTPFFSHNVATAMRDFTAAANDPSTDLHRFSLDYSLHHIGVFTEDTGLISSFTPINLGTANQFIKQNIEVIEDVQRTA